MTVFPAAASVPCSLHKSHAPFPVVIEFHHVIPRAWGHAFPDPQVLPAGATPGHDDTGPLWDARTIAVCPTSHRSVHAALVALVRERPAVGSRLERRVARLALDRALEAGITPDMLRAAHQYGVA